MSQAVVTANDLSLTFQTNDGPVHALAGVNLSVAKGEFVFVHRTVRLRQDNVPAGDR